MKHLTDIFVVLWIAFVATNGWDKGLLRTLVGPVSFFLCVLGSVFYFHAKHNLAGALLLTSLGPFFLSITLSILLVFWNRNIDKGLPPEGLSRMGGCVFNFIWGIFIISTGLITMSILPTNNIPHIKAIRDNVTGSYSFALTERFVKSKIPFLNNIETVSKISQDPKKLTKIQNTPEFLSLYRDSKMRDISSDEKITKYIHDKSLIKLLEHPKIIDMWQDKELMKKIFDLLTVIEKEEVKKESSPPKIYEVQP